MIAIKNDGDDDDDKTKKKGLTRLGRTQPPRGAVLLGLADAAAVHRELRRRAQGGGRGEPGGAPGADADRRRARRRPQVPSHHGPPDARVYCRGGGRRGSRRADVDAPGEHLCVGPVCLRHRAEGGLNTSDGRWAAALPRDATKTYTYLPAGCVLRAGPARPSVFRFGWDEIYRASFFFLFVFFFSHFLFSLTLHPTTPLRCTT